MRVIPKIEEEFVLLSPYTSAVTITGKERHKTNKTGMPTTDHKLTYDTFE